MKPTPSKSLLTLGLLAAALLPVAAAEPNGDQLLKQMSAKLAAAKSFHFEATREIDPALLGGHEIPEKARVSVNVQRPNKIDATAVSKSSKRRFVADGRTATLVDEKNHFYATVPMRTTLDGLVDRLDEQYGFVPPLAEFVVSDLYKGLKRQAHTVTYLGRGKTKAGFLGLGGVECHRIGLKGKLADAELWVGVGDQLPQKLVATFHREGQPQVSVAFSSWNITVAAGDFTFTPAKGAQKIEMVTTR